MQCRNSTSAEPIPVKVYPAVMFFISWQNAPFVFAIIKLITMVSPVFQRYEAGLNLSLVNSSSRAGSVSMLIIPSVMVSPLE